LSRPADLEDASAKPATAVVVHPPPPDQSPANATEANEEDDHFKDGSSNSHNSVADRSSFSLFGLLTRWNKEGDDSLRLQEFQEQVCGSS
jgi:hypothetical protein